MIIHSCTALAAELLIIADGVFLDKTVKGVYSNGKRWFLNISSRNNRINVISNSFFFNFNRFYYFNFIVMMKLLELLNLIIKINIGLLLACLLFLLK